MPTAFMDRNWFEVGIVTESGIGVGVEIRVWFGQGIGTGIKTDRGTGKGAGIRTVVIPFLEAADIQSADMGLYVHL